MGFNTSSLPLYVLQSVNAISAKHGNAAKRNPLFDLHDFFIRKIPRKNLSLRWPKSLEHLGTF